MKFSALVLFMILWLDHRLQPDRALGMGRRLARQLSGVLDFAGGTVVHINAGIAGLVCALVSRQALRLRPGEHVAVQSGLRVIGASLLWVGWFGFNAGSAVTANGHAGMAMAVTQIATATAALAWMFCEWIDRQEAERSRHRLGRRRRTRGDHPGFGLRRSDRGADHRHAAGVVCFFAATTVKKTLGYDDALDAFGVHAVGGIIGAIADRRVRASGSRRRRGQGLARRQSAPDDRPDRRCRRQRSFGRRVTTFVILSHRNIVTGVRVSQAVEVEGLDINLHGEVVQ